MDNPWDAVNVAMHRSRELEAAIKNYSAQMARILCGRLRHCNSDDLAELKKELRDFNINTKRWRKK